MKRLLVYLAVLQGLDVASTLHALHLGAVEANPVGQVALAGGAFGLVAVKAAGTLLIAGIAWVLWRGSPLNQVQAVLGLRMACSLMVAVVGWNSWVTLLRV